MNRALTSAFLGIVALAAVADTAAAQSRYAPRPPVVLSPNLSEPWLLQLAPRHRAVVDEPPARAAVPAAAPVGYVPWRPAAVAGADADPTFERRAPAAAEPMGRRIRAEFLPNVVAYRGPHQPGTIIINTEERYLYLVEEGGTARRYGVGVGRPGFEWAGQHRITRKAEWPSWRPPAEMLKRQPHLPRFMDGGPKNPLGARALYLGSSLYRIHGTNEPWTIGSAVSSGCIRMRNEDITDLYERVKVGTRVIVI